MSSVTPNSFSIQTGRIYALQSIPIIEDVLHADEAVRLAVRAFDPTTFKPTTLVGPQVIVYDPLGVISAGPVAPTQNTSLTNEYFYNFTVSSNPTLGTWTAIFTGTISGKSVSTSVRFEVI